MNKYFLHTIELMKAIDTDKFVKLKKNNDFKIKCAFESENYINTKYCMKGLVIEIRKYSNNEIKTYKKLFQMTIVANISKLIYNDDPVNHIYSLDDLKWAVENLLDLMDELNTEYHIGEIEEFTLNRLDIARDVHNIPENIIKEVNKMLYRLPMYEGYTHNTRLEKNCIGFKRENSFNAVNNSQGIEFVVYNKHKATLDNNYAPRFCDYYMDTIRIELRCKKKYINTHFLDKNLKGTLINAYNDMLFSVETVYKRLFKFPTNICHLESKILIKYLFDQTGNKKSRCRRMVTLLDELDKYPNEDLQKALDSVYPSEKRQRNIKNQYMNYGVSPITMRNSSVPFIQSIDSLLEFTIPTEKESELYLKAKKHYSNVFFH
ncbi:MAG: phage/plasmid replication protein [Hominimerdicola sp.]